MFRIPFRSPFSLLFIFEDIDGIPVDISGVALDVWLTTRQAAPPFNAYIRRKSSLNAVVLDNGTLLVKAIDSKLFPGKLKAIINLHADVENLKEALPAHKPHEHHPGDVIWKSREYITLSPDIPVEIIDPTYSPEVKRFNPDEPIKVKVRINMHRPQLTKHVTVGELNNAIREALEGVNGESAELADVQPIIDMFTINDQ